MDNKTRCKLCGSLVSGKVIILPEVPLCDVCSAKAMNFTLGQMQEVLAINQIKGLGDLLYPEGIPVQQANERDCKVMPFEGMVFADYTEPDAVILHIHPGKNLKCIRIRVSNGALIAASKTSHKSISIR